MRALPHQPLVSVLLPVRNAATTLGTAVQSIQAQTFAGWELLLIDDASTDHTVALASALARQDSRIRLERAPARGLVAALNHGLQCARGPLVARMDADDTCDPTRFERQVAFLDTNPQVDLVGCRVRFGGDPLDRAGYALHVEWTNSLLTPEAIRLNRFIESPFPHPSVIFRRDLVERFGGYRDGLFPEDYELWLRWLDAGVVMAKAPETLFTWNDPPGRLSRTDPRYAPEAFYRLKADYLARELHPRLGSRQLWVWGAGRLTRRRAELLEHHRLTIHGWIDINPHKTHQRPGARPVVLPDQLPHHDAALVVAYVAKRGARDLIRSALVAHHFVEGRHFWMAA